MGSLPKTALPGPQGLLGLELLAQEAGRIDAADPLALVVIDPALCAFHAEANHAAPVRDFVSLLVRKLARPLACAVLLVAHSTKAARAGQDRFDAGQVSGSAAWHDAARAVLAMTREHGQNGPALAITKANYGPAFLSAEPLQQGHLFCMECGTSWASAPEKEARYGD